MSKHIYFFGNGVAEGHGLGKNSLGGKGAGLHEMTFEGLPVPAGFTITTETCLAFYTCGKKLPEGLMDDVKRNIERMETAMAKKFGDPQNPLLVSVRSGARVSMPGMMDTVLNVGLNDTTVEGLAKLSGNPRFAFDSYRRLIQMFSNVVLGIKGELLEKELVAVKAEQGVALDTEIDEAHLRKLIQRYKNKVMEIVKIPFPQEPYKQLEMAIGAVFESWNNDRAIAYRDKEGYSHDWGTAVNIVAMVFGNMGSDSATGVAFTRDPATGEPYFYGEYLINAQGEDVVAGIRTPQPLSVKGKLKDSLPSMEETMPECHKKLDDIRHRLEKHYRHTQDIEFTIERNKVYMLQTRNGKLGPAAAIKIAVDMVHEGIISKEEALMRVTCADMERILHPQLDQRAKKGCLAKGLPASPGGATGRVVFTAKCAEERVTKDKWKVILVRQDTCPDDVRGMYVSEGILTSRGGMTSHAAVVTRQKGKACVAGCGAFEIDAETKTATVTTKDGKVIVFKEGDEMTIDGSTGEVFQGRIPTIEGGVFKEAEELLSWAQDAMEMKVWTNADTGKDAARARAFGARGIGLTRTEHMFFVGDRIHSMREFILADSDKKKAAIDKMRPFQQHDFEEIFRAMDGLPVTIRLLDPPLHEFLPTEDKDITLMAQMLKVTEKEVNSKITSLHEANPMLGHRGCRLGITEQELSDMQVRAILDAAVQVKSEGKQPVVEIMVPLVGMVNELKVNRLRMEEILKEEYSGKLEGIPVLIGTMIELPRACIRGGEIAEFAEFFSFGTNDLTQTTFGFSRDDTGSFVPRYQERGVMNYDPFQTVDTEGVGELMRICVERGRKTKPKLQIGICGEHGGDPKSVKFCHSLGLNYVSCSPMRVPVAILASAQATLEKRGVAH